MSLNASRILRALQGDRFAPETGGLSFARSDSSVMSARSLWRSNRVEYPLPSVTGAAGGSVSTYSGGTVSFQPQNAPPNTVGSSVLIGTGTNTAVWIAEPPVASQLTFQSPGDASYVAWEPLPTNFNVLADASVTGTNSPAITLAGTTSWGLNFYELVPGAVAGCWLSTGKNEESTNLAFTIGGGVAATVSTITFTPADVVPSQFTPLGVAGTAMFLGPLVNVLNSSSVLSTATVVVSLDGSGHLLVSLEFATPLGADTYTIGGPSPGNVQNPLGTWMESTTEFETRARLIAAAAPPQSVPARDILIVPPNSPSVEDLIAEAMGTNITGYA